MKLLLPLSLATLATGVSVRGVEKASASLLPHEAEAVLPPQSKGLEDALMSLLSQGNTPALGRFVKEIQRMLDENMKPKVLENLRAAQKDLDAALTSFATCRRDLAVADNKTRAAWKAKLTPLGQTYGQCRVQESAARKVKTSTKAEEDQAKQFKASSCSALSEMEKRKFNDNTICIVNGGEAYDGFADRVVARLDQRKKEYVTKRTECKQATTKVEELSKRSTEVRRRYENKNDECNKGQDVLDTASCSYLDGCSGNCKLARSCWEEATKNLERAKKTAQAQEKGMRSEWEGVLRLQCMSAAIASSDEDRPATINACKRVDYSDKVAREIAIRYPATPDQGACPLPDDYAGTEKYRQLFYSKLPFDAPAKDCIAACCTCSGFQCGSGFRIKPNFAKILGPNRAACCDKTCGDFRCPTFYKLKDGANSLVGNSRDECCKMDGPIGPVNFYYNEGGSWPGSLQISPGRVYMNWAVGSWANSYKSREVLQAGMRRGFRFNFVVRSGYTYTHVGLTPSGATMNTWPALQYAFAFHHTNYVCIAESPWYSGGRSWCANGHWWTHWSMHHNPRQFELRVTASNTIQYFVDGGHIWTSHGPPQYPLMAAAFALYGGGDEVFNAQWVAYN